MTVIPVYNKLIAPDSDVYFRRDQFRYLAGNVNVDEKVVLLIAKKDESRAERSEDSFYPIGLTGTVAEISNDGYAVVRAGGRVNVESVVINRDRSISLMTSRRSDIRDLPASGPGCRQGILPGLSVGGCGRDLRQSDAVPGDAGGHAFHLDVGLQ